MFTGVWVNPNLSLAGNDPFRITAEIMGGNYSMIWHQLIRDELATNQVRGCFMLDEEACFRQTGERAIDWTRDNHPNHPEYLQIMEASVASVLAQRFGSGDTNTAPVAAPDSYTVEQDTVLTVTAPGLLGNDTDADGDALTARIRTYASHGTATVNQDGSFSYTPHDGFVGEDSFGYVADDGTEDSQVATVTINVTEAGGGEEPPADCDECQAALAAYQAELAALKQSVQAAVSALQNALDENSNQ